jgi:hypothetical protein
MANLLLVAMMNHIHAARGIPPVSHPYRELVSWVNWPSRAAALMAAELGVEAAEMQKALETHVRAHLDELAEVRPEFR